MYTVETTKQFDKSFKRCLKRNLDPELLWEVIELLQKDRTLPAQYRPHKLSGRFFRSMGVPYQRRLASDMATK